MAANILCKRRLFVCADRLCGSKVIFYFGPSRAVRPLKLAFCLITVRKHDGWHGGAGGERVITQHGGAVWM